MQEMIGFVGGQKMWGINLSSNLERKLKKKQLGYCLQSQRRICSTGLLLGPWKFQFRHFANYFAIRYSRASLLTNLQVHIPSQGNSSCPQCYRFVFVDRGSGLLVRQMIEPNFLKLLLRLLDLDHAAT